MNHLKLPGLALLSVALLTSACGKKDEATADLAASNVTAQASVPAAPAMPAPAAPAAAAEFSVNSLPVSNAALGKFPFFGLPAGYAPQNKPKSLDYGHFPFWTGKSFKDVEGQTYLVTIVHGEEKEFSSFALKKNMETLFQQAGAVKISEARIPNVALDALPRGAIGEMLMGLGDPWNDPVATWVIRRPHDAIWISYSTNSAQGSLAVVQTKPFVATAALLPADQLKRDLDKTGKAVIHVNFATDQAVLLPDAKPQLDAVVALLKADPALRLALNGYTDDTGSDAHNVALSEGRAKAVQTMLLANGIKPERIQAKGYGRMSPVSTNGDEAGKAANRRVELIKL